MILDCGTGARPLGNELMQKGPLPLRASVLRAEWCGKLVCAELLGNARLGADGVGDVERGRAVGCDGDGQTVE